jgi:hypothetical protein
MAFVNVLPCFWCEDVGIIGLGTYGISNKSQSVIYAWWKATL